VIIAKGKNQAKERTPKERVC